jgi:hypothetical protein
MKKKKISKKLILNKETIENLDNTERKAIKGGFETIRLGLACMSSPVGTCQWTVCICE